MAEHFSEMITTRVDLAQSLEAGFESYLEDLADGYGRYLAPVVEQEEPELDPGYHLVLLRRSVRRHRQRLEKHDVKVVKQAHEIAIASAAVARSRDAVDSKLRAVRSTCRGIYGPASLPLIGVAGLFPRGAARLHRFGLSVTSNLKSDLGLEPQIELELGDGVPVPTAQLAGQLGGELEQLADRVKARHRERRKVVGLRLRRQLLIQEFDRGVRGIVRIAQGISRLAGREDLGRRFRPILRRTLRQLEEQAAEEAAGAETADDAEDAEAEASQASEEAAPQEASA